MSIVKQLDKQLKRRNSQINILEKQLELSKKRCKNLGKKKALESVEVEKTVEVEKKQEPNASISDEEVNEIVDNVIEETVPEKVEETVPENNEDDEQSSEEEDEDEDDDDELSLVKKKIKKVYYYLDINTNNVYEIADDDELGDLLGVYDKKKRKIVKS